MVWYGMVWYGMVWYGMVWYVCMYVCIRTNWNKLSILESGCLFRSDSKAPDQTSSIKSAGGCDQSDPILWVLGRRFWPKPSDGSFFPYFPIFFRGMNIHPNSSIIPSRCVFFLQRLGASETSAAGESAVSPAPNNRGGFWRLSHGFSKDKPKQDIVYPCFIHVLSIYHRKKWFILMWWFKHSWFTKAFPKHLDCYRDATEIRLGHPPSSRFWRYHSEGTGQVAGWPPMIKTTEQPPSYHEEMVHFLGKSG